MSANVRTVFETKLESMRRPCQDTVAPTAHDVQISFFRHRSHQHVLAKVSTAARFESGSGELHSIAHITLFCSIINFVLEYDQIRNSSTSSRLIVPNRKLIVPSSSSSTTTSQSPLFSTSAAVATASSTSANDLLSSYASYPVAQVTRLPNGMRVITEAAAGTDAASVGVFIDSGSRFEDEENNGVAHFLEHLTFKVGFSFCVTLYPINHSAFLIVDANRALVVARNTVSKSRSKTWAAT